jgi:YVTN family beta-propeller protein
MHWRSLVVVALLFFAPRAVAQQPPVLKHMATIPLPNVEGRIDHMAFDAQSGRLFVAALGNNSVEVVDTRAGKVIHSIKGLREPQGIGLAPDSAKLYVANAGDGSCRIFDAGTYQPVTSIDLKSDADNVRYDSTGKRMYIGYGDGALAVLDATKGDHLTDIKLSAHPESFQLEKRGRRIFVNLPEGGSVIAVVDRDRGVVAETWSLSEAKSNFPMALDEVHHRLFVGCRKPAKLVVIDTSTGKAIAGVDCAGDTDDVWYDPARSRIYVTGGEGAITVIEQSDADHYRAVEKLSTAPGARTSFFVADTGLLCVAVPHRGSQKAELLLLIAKSVLPWAPDAAVVRP